MDPRYPVNLIIDQMAATTISSSLNSNTSVVEQTTATTASGSGTQGSGAGDITVAAPVAWNTAATLTLDAYHGIAVNAPITASGAGGVVLTTNDGGTGGDLTFAQGAGLAFTGTEGSGQSLTINSVPYTLIYSMAELDAIDGASAVDGSAVTQFGAGVSGVYALAKPLDASGTAYTRSLIGTQASVVFAGTLEGLGNGISGLSMAGANANGLISDLDTGGILRDIGVSGSINGVGTMGGLVGANNGLIANSHAAVSVKGGNNLGGLAGVNAGTIINSYATGAVTSATLNVGGLVGENNGTITNAYATGAVSQTSAGQTAGGVGGLIGDMLGGSISNVYATGATSEAGTSPIGGLVGSNVNLTPVVNGYFDTQTTGQASGIGYNPHALVATGLTTAQLQSGSATFDIAFAGGAAGLYPYLATFYPNGAQAVSGTALNADGTPTSAAQVGLYTDGSLIGGGTVSSGVNGYVYAIVPPDTYASGAATIGETIALSGATVASGLNYADRLALDGNGNLALSAVTSGLFRAATSDVLNSTLQDDHASTFGSANYANLQSILVVTPETLITSGAFTVDQAISADAAFVLQTGGELTIDAGDTISSTATGDAVVLAADGNFINNAGANAVSTANGRWLVYTQATGDATSAAAGNAYGGLSAKSYYGDAYNFGTGAFAAAPNAGNRFVYGYQPTLTVAPTTQSVTYNGAAQTDTYGVSGLANGDSQADALQGTVAGLTTSSKNAAAYSLTAGGTLTSDENYLIALGTGAFTISPEAITVTAVANSKTYDGATTAAATPTLTSGTLYDTATYSETYASRNAGTGLTLTPTVSISDGNGGANYDVTYAPSMAGVITPEAVTFTATINGKSYDGTRFATATPMLTSGTLYDTALLSETYASKNVGTGLEIDPAATIADGNGGANYTVTLTSSMDGAISPEAITVTANANTKTYDGTTSAVATPTLTSGTLYDAATYSETYASRNAGNGLEIDPAITIADGNGGANYTVTLNSVSTGVINPEAITITAMTETKTYDGGTDSSQRPTLTSGTLYDPAGMAQNFTTFHAGTNLEIDPGAFINDGNNGANYVLTLQPVFNGTINPEAITVTAATNTKTYDGTTSASATPTLTSGTLYNSAASSETYASKNAGTGLEIDPNIIIDDGVGGADYTVTLVSNANGVINPEAITVTAAINTKTYNGTTSAAAMPTLTSGTLYDAATYSETYASKNAGMGLTLNPAISIADGNGGANYAVTYDPDVTGEIDPEAITITAATNSKTYDGTISAAAMPTLTSGTLYDVATYSESYASKNAGTGLALTPTVAIADGNGGANYDVTLVSNANGVIDAKDLSATVAANDKTYDGTMADSGSAILSGVISGDQVSLSSGTYTFGDKNAGANKTVTISGIHLAGADAGNYTLTIPATTLASILQKALSATVAANDKTYDGTTADTGSAHLGSGVISGDQVSLSSGTYTFADKNAGANKTVTISGIHLTGADAGNYSLTIPATVANILQKALTLSLTGTVTKTYDGTANATLGAGNIALSGVIATDTVTANGSAEYADAHAGSGKPVTVTGISLAGADGRNYRLAQSTVTANIGQIDPRAITLTADDVVKLLGQADPALTYSVTDGSFVSTDGTTGALVRISGETPGSYAILQGSLGVSSDYVLTFVDGQFLIAATPIETSFAGILPGQGGFTSTTGLTPGVPPNDEILATQTQIASNTQNSDINCPVGDATCSNAPYPTNRDIGSDIRFVPGP